MAEPTPPPSLTCGARENSLSVNGTSKNKESKTSLLTPTVKGGRAHQAARVALMNSNSSQIRDQVYASFPLTPKTTKQVRERRFEPTSNPTDIRGGTLRVGCPPAGGARSRRDGRQIQIGAEGTVRCVHVDRLNSVPNPIRKRIMYGGKGLGKG